MPFEPQVLLHCHSAFRIHGNVEMGERIEKWVTCWIHSLWREEEGCVANTLLLWYIYTGCWQVESWISCSNIYPKSVGDWIYSWIDCNITTRAHMDWATEWWGRHITYTLCLDRWPRPPIPKIHAELKRQLIGWVRWSMLG
jgi:hypothetical protein